MFANTKEIVHMTLHFVHMTLHLWAVDVDGIFLKNGQQTKIKHY